MEKLKSSFTGSSYVFKLYPLLVAVFVVIQIECILFVYKQISLFGITTTLSGITFPINLLILAIVTHCYGKQSARQLVWINNIVILQFVGYNLFAQNTNWSSLANMELVSAYETLIPLFMRSGLTALIAENIAEFLFIFLYSRYKNNKPKLAPAKNTFYEFWGLFKFSFMANFLMLMVAYSSIFYEKSFYDIVTLVAQVMLIKSIIEILFSPLAIYLIIKIKQFEGFDIHDFSGNNPFLFLMDYKYLNFNPVNNNENNSNN